jgi:hypothetical protein
MSEGNDLGLPAGTKNEAVSYGYLIMLEPLLVLHMTLNLRA